MNQLTSNSGSSGQGSTRAIHNSIARRRWTQTTFRLVNGLLLCSSLGMICTASLVNAGGYSNAVSAGRVMTKMVLGQGFGNVRNAPKKEGASPPASAALKLPAITNQPRFRLASQDFLTGTLLDCEKPGKFRVQPPLLAAPLTFPVAAVEKLEFPQADKQMKAVGEYCFELAGGDLLFGKLVKLSDKEAEIDTELFGKLHVGTSLLRRIERWDGSDELVYMGPNGLTDWDKVSELPAREEGDLLVLDTDGASVHGNVGLPPKAVIELELAWARKPNFTLSLGVDKLESTVQRAFGLEVWDDEIVARRETLREADIATVSPLAFGAGGIRLMIYLDQVAGRMQVLTPSGKQLADLRVPEKTPTPQTGLRLTNKRGEIKLERLRITRWRDTPNGEIKTERSRIHKTDGAVVYGAIESFDSMTGKLVVRTEKENVSIEAKNIASLFLPGPETPRGDGVRMAYRNGTRITGSLQQTREGKMLLKTNGIQEEFAAPLANLRSISVTQQDRSSVDPFGTFPILNAEGIRLRGKLVPRAQADALAAPFAWQPVLSLDPAVLKPGIAGRIDFGRSSGTAQVVVAPRVEIQRVQPVEPEQPKQPQPAGAWNPFGQQNLNGISVTNLYLRTGDTIPCRVVGIDEEGLLIDSTATKSKRIPHDKIKAVLLIPGAEMPNPQKLQVPEQQLGRMGWRGRGMAVVAPPSTPHLDNIKSERLMTLPRIQKNNPPTHLIMAANGDILRGRISSMDDKQLHVELRLENREVPRDRLALIIWLHPDELEGPKDAAPPAKPGEKLPAEAKKVEAALPEQAVEKPAPDVKPPEVVKPLPVEAPPAVVVLPPKAVPGFRVHVVRVDSTRITFNAKKLATEQVNGAANETLSGDNEILGACSASLSEMRELLFGTEIETAAAKLKYHKWRMHRALDPLPDPDGGDESGGGNRTGLESRLIGQVAPDFELDVQNGGKFRLSSKKGSVVVLDFWASWCGPCMQALPQVHAAAEKLKAQGVVLVAVNIEETPEQVAAAMKRLKLPATVAFDVEGKIAAKYAVRGIPRTVIIDREGKYARIYEGGSAEFEQEIQTALETVLGIAKPKPPVTPAP